MFKIIADGGFVMYPLIICSIIIWAVVMDKFLLIRNLQRAMDNLFSNANKLVKEKKYHEARGLGLAVPELLTGPFIALFDGKCENVEVWSERIQRRLAQTRQGMKKNVWLLGTIGAASPFLGLFGTVVGIIKSFDSIAKAGKSGFAVVASGLSEALIATATGIIVAVVAVVFFNYLQTRLSVFYDEFKLKLADLMDEINES